MNLKALMAAALVSTVLVVTSGCSAFGDKDEANAPMELVEFQQRLAVQRVWETNTGAGIGRGAQNLKPFYVDGEFWVGDHEGRISVINAENGDVVRSFDTGLDLASGPTVYGDRVLVGTVNGQAALLDRATGTIEWRAQLSSEVLAAPVFGDGIVTARCIDGRVFGLDVETGRREWVYDRSVPLLTLRGNSDPLVRAGQVFLGYDDGTVAAIRIRDGALLWEQRVSIPEGRSELDRLSDIDGPLAVVGSDLYAVTQHGRMASLAIDSGRIQWVKDIASASGLTVFRTQLVSSASDDVVWMVDRQSGATVWQNEQLLRRGLTRPVFQGGFVLVADKEGYLHWLDADTGEFAARTRTSKEPPAAAPQVIGNTVYLLNRDGRLSAWRAGGQG